MKYAFLIITPQVFFGALLLSGCAFTSPMPSLPLVQRNLETRPCPKPAQIQTGKDMPAFVGSLPLCAADNIERLLTRDARFRQYIKALEASISCYERISKPTIH